MGLLFTLTLIAVIAWVTVRSMTREKAARKRTEAIRTRVMAANGLEDAFVSQEDGSLVGLNADASVIIVGKGAEDRTLPIGAVIGVEGLRDGAVMVRSDQALPAAPTAERRNPADLPERIRTLSLRLLLDDGAHEVLFFDGGKHGVPPNNAEFLAKAALTESWFRKLSGALGDKAA